MPIKDLFSKRRAKRPKKMPDVYRYDVLPHALRVQVIHIMNDAFRDDPEAYDAIVNTLCREYGVFRLLSERGLPAHDSQMQLHAYLLNVQEVDRGLDVLELTASAIADMGRTRPYLRQRADDLLSELNTRFMEHRVGYRFEGEQMVRMDAEVIHAEVIKPSIALLSRRAYSGAQEEFLKGLEHYRRGNMKESMNECHKAFESVMKTICQRRRWPVKPSAGASDLISICFKKQLVPSIWQEQFSSLRKVLETGTAPARNQMAAHGQGPEKMEVPRHLAAYVIHMTAAAILFLAEAEAGGAGQ